MSILELKPKVRSDIEWAHDEGFWLCHEILLCSSPSEAKKSPKDKGNKGAVQLDIWWPHSHYFLSQWTRLLAMAKLQSELITNP